MKETLLGETDANEAEFFLFDKPTNILRSVYGEWTASPNMKHKYKMH